MIFVDDVRHPLGRMVFCHCWSDQSVKELIAFMELIGVDPKWIQGHPRLSLPKFRGASWVHFDITLGKKALAIKNGAVLTDVYGPLEHVARLNIAYGRKHGDQLMIEQGYNKLSMVATVRGVRAKIERA